MRPKFLNSEYVILTLMLMSVSIPRFNQLIYPHHIGILALQILTIILAAVLILKRKALFEFPAIIIISCLLILSGNLAGLLNSRGFDTAFLAIVNKDASFLLMLCSAALVATDKKRFKDIIPVMTTLSLFVLILTSLPELFLSGMHEPVKGQLGHANILAFFIIGLIPFPLYLFHKHRSLVIRSILLVLVVASLILLLFTRSSAAIIALFLPWILVLYVFIKNRNRALAVIISIISISALIIIFMFLYKSGEVSSLGRSDAIHAAWKLFLQAPLSGHGPGQFIFDYPAFRSPDFDQYVSLTVREPLDHVHFEPLHALYEGGVISGIGITVLAISVIVTAVKMTLNSGKQYFDTVLAIATLSLLLHSTLTLAPSREGWLLLALFTGALFAIYEKSKNVNINRNLVTVLSILVLSAVFPATKRIISDYHLEKGRNWEVFWGVKDLHALEASVALWPEQLSSRSLLAWGLYQKSKKYSKNEENQKNIMLDRALYEYETVHKMAPGFLKDNLHRSRVLVARGHYSRALELLDDMPVKQDSTERVELQSFIRELVTDKGDLHH